MHLNEKHLNDLEDEAIYVIREVASQFERPIMLYSVGKDSSALLHLASKAFAPGRIPFSLLHIDTGYKFPEMIAFRDRIKDHYDVDLKVYRNEEAIKDEAHPSKLGTLRCCGLLKTKALLDALKLYEVDAALGGARRDEEKSRAKERFFSFRDQHGQWDPKNQRPELWDSFNTLIHPGESLRVFPLSNWTELDIWLYIKRENIPIVPLYFSASRPMISKQGQLIPAVGRLGNHPDAVPVPSRYRTLGCAPCTGAVPSTARTLDDIIRETVEAQTSERVTRIIDYDGEASMEKKKREGYF
ncbi:sulfate adenylyltransferase subunit CysD [Pseudobacteriovorax antillogorgiicola]|uniref:Sulfate adenylyltransferase subunit 2 n=1 Tax=Pseudobacteriovorax antillogorgiicola TaxID=1513793 RepID=A0A1Y6CN27_9BACT|nr:sulfate adenylyltransferase subunit CysD [Pseudobacteriovorax antillogorgiicola]TCS44591.1 sulfate adenylyltransferase subunit 2 [Pseudobacteriovorax antillogorgiicola]SMF78105.1 sulfate adenylyltransferase subunit 2 [Pseudobacteriovorax antillogorgiicola]